MRRLIRRVARVVVTLFFILPLPMLPISKAPSPMSIGVDPNNLVFTSAATTILPAGPDLRRQEVLWVDAHHTAYFQKYTLSCEAAATRLSLAPFGVDLSEDQILAMMPVDAHDPERGLVMQNINGSNRNADGSPNWANYGAHAPVVALVLNQIYQQQGLQNQLSAEVQRLNDEQLIALLQSDVSIVGAIIWVARDIYGKPPPVNNMGQVLGEHVQWVSPLVDSQGYLVIYDVEPWPNQPYHLLHPFNRDLFHYELVLIRRLP